MLKPQDIPTTTLSFKTSGFDVLYASTVSVYNPGSGLSAVDDIFPLLMSILNWVELIGAVNVSVKI